MAQHETSPTNRRRIYPETGGANKHTTQLPYHNPSYGWCALQQWWHCNGSLRVLRAKLRVVLCYTAVVASGFWDHYVSSDAADALTQGVIMMALARDQFPFVCFANRGELTAVLTAVLRFALCRSLLLMRRDRAMTQFTIQISHYYCRLCFCTTQGTSEGRRLRIFQLLTRTQNESTQYQQR